MTNCYLTMTTVQWVRVKSYIGGEKSYFSTHAMSVRVFLYCGRKSFNIGAYFSSLSQRERESERNKYMDLAIFVQAEGHSNGKVLKSLSSYIKNSEQRATGRRFGAIYTEDKYVRNFDQSYLENYFRNSIIGCEWVFLSVWTFLIWRVNLNTLLNFGRKKN